MKKFNGLITYLLYILIGYIFFQLVTMCLFNVQELAIPIILFLVFMILLIGLERKIKTRKMYIVIDIPIILLVVICILIIVLLSRTNKFIDSITNSNIEIQSYYLLVLKEDNIDNYRELDGEKIGSIIEVSDIIEDDIEFNIKKYNNVAEIILDLFNGNIRAIMVDDIYYNNMLELIPNFDENIRVLKIFEKEQQLKVETSSVDVRDNSFIMYISGIDTYGSIETLGRSDVNILVVVNPSSAKILLISIPRDYYIRLSGTVGYKDKLTHAGVYGIDTSIKTIEELLDIDINYYLRVNFNTVVKLVDELGGVDVYSDITFTTSNNKNCYLIKGNNHLNGSCALAFSRERYAYSEGDRHRGENQQQVISSIISKVTTTETILNNYLGILEEMNGSFQTNFELEDLVYLLKKQLKEKKNWEINKISLDGYDSYNYTYSYQGEKLYVMEPDYDTVEKAKDSIRVLMGKQS